MNKSELYAKQLKEVEYKLKNINKITPDVIYVVK